MRFFGTVDRLNAPRRFESMISKRPFLRHQARGFRRSMHLDELPLFWEMRLGKTLLATRWLAHKHTDQKLILCPKEVFPAWSRELSLEGIPHQVLRGTTKQKEKQLAQGRAEGLQWFVTNYESLLRVERGRKTRASSIARAGWDAAVCDESTKIRNWKSNAYKIAKKCLGDATYKAILSGLPNPEGPEDYVPQLLFLWGELMGQSNAWDWRQRHMIKLDYGGQVVKRRSHKLLKEIVADRAIRLTRKQAGIGSAKIRQSRHVTVPSKIKTAIRRAEQDMELDDRMTKNILEALTWISRLCGGRFDDPTLQHDAKIREVLGLVEGDLRGEPLVIWARYTAEIEAIHDALRARRWSSRVVYGKTSDGLVISDKAREENVADFQAGKVQILVVQPKSLKMGVDLSISSTAIYYSNYWDAEIRAQTEDRIIHPLKTDPVLLIDIVGEDTPDEAIVEAVRQKRITSSAFNAVILQHLRQRRAA